MPTPPNEAKDEQWMSDGDDPYQKLCKPPKTTDRVLVPDKSEAIGRVGRQNSPAELSYAKHCIDPIAAAKEDLLGQALELLREYRGVVCAMTIGTQYQGPPVQFDATDELLDKCKDVPHA